MRRAASCLLTTAWHAPTCETQAAEILTTVVRVAHLSRTV